MHLIELYKSVQGESSFAGLPCMQSALRLVRFGVHLQWWQGVYAG